LCRLPGFEILGITPPAAAIMTTLAIIPLSIAARAGTVLLAAPPRPMSRGERAPMLALPT
jgi:monovalent cation:H+ antiporter, CPA1 family